MKLKNKLVIIVGATGGIGSALARELIGHSCKLALVGRNHAQLEKLASELNSMNLASCKAFTCPFQTETQLHELYQHIREQFAQVPDILVNALGASALGNIDDMPLSEYELMFKVNFWAPLAMAKAILPDMKKTRTGTLVFLGSGAALRGLPASSAYCASKTALLSFVDSLRVEVASSGIHVLYFSPGPVDTALVNSIKTFGSLKESYIPREKHSPQRVARRLVAALENNTSRFEGTWKALIVRWLNAWAPGLVDRILLNKSSL